MDKPTSSFDTTAAPEQSHQRLPHKAARFHQPVDLGNPPTGCQTSPRATTVQGECDDPPDDSIAPTPVLTHQPGQCVIFGRRTALQFARPTNTLLTNIVFKSVIAVVNNPRFWFIGLVAPQVRASSNSRI